MEYVLIFAIVAAAVMVLASLGRGLFLFARGHQAAENGDGAGNLAKQNQMMVSRIKWQAITILLLVVVGLFASGR